MSSLTISDIAKKANVSKTTVSRVINHHPSVKPETRDRVLAVIAKEHYLPSAAARSLSKQVSDTVGVIVPEIENTFFGEALLGINEELDRHQLTMICCNTNDSVEKDFVALETIKHHRVRGLLYTPAGDYLEQNERKRLIKLLREIDTPVILMDRRVEGIEFDGVFFNDAAGVYGCTKSLIEAGHKKIAIINAELRQWSLARIRYSGYEQAHEEAGLPIDPKYIFAGNYRESMAYQLAKEMLAMKDRPTAVVTCNNVTTMGFVRALYERGEVLGRDIDCAGLDKIDLLELMGADFSYIERDACWMGRTAMELLINRIAFPDRPKQEIVCDPPVVLSEKLLAAVK